MKAFFTSLLLCWSLLTYSQQLILSFPIQTALSGQTLEVPLTAVGFDSIVSMQFSVNWDETVLAYTGVELTVLPLFAVGDVEAAAGRLRISWFDDTGQGQSFPDGTVIAVFKFTAIGDVGESTTIDITGNPLAIEVFKATNTTGIFEPIAFSPQSGFVEIVDQDGFNAVINGVSCFGFADGSASVSLASDTINYTLNWTDEAGNMYTGFQLNNLPAGDYQVELLDEMNALVLTTQLTIPGPNAPLSIGEIQLTISDCNTPTGAVTINAVGGTAPYAFTLAEQISATGEFTMLAAGDYPIAIVDGNNCMVTDTIEVEAAGGISIEIPDSLQICAGESITIAPDVEGDFLWSTGETTDSILITQAGVYGVTVSNAQGCEDSATFEAVSINSINAQIENDFLETCPSDTIQLLISGAENYNWLNGANTLSATDIANPQAFPGESTTYLVEVSNACAVDTLEVPIMVFEITATAGADTCIALGTELELDAKGGLFYLWADNSFPVSDQMIPNPIVIPEDSTTYEVAITDINGCVTEDEILVLVVNSPVDFIIPINFLSPNEDGFNDVLDFGPLSKYGNNALKVYNRWGDLVYQKLNYQLDEERFDGTFEGKPLPAGSYFYVLSFKQGAVQQTITIVRE